ncbi:MAG: carboxymuconolactone decarboxylase family protein [Alphaproteobacteria bacterium]|nr:carboxymuconolactone decarboxylase family protein [Alphaproteobacteria bacterium]
MARLPYLNEEDLAEGDKDLLKRGMNLHRLLAHSPEAARRFGSVAQYIRFESTLDSRLREMAILQVGYLSKSPYEYSHHLRLGRDFGVTDDDVKAMENETAGNSSSLPELDRTVLRGAREMTNDLKFSDETYDTLRAHLSEAHILDLIMTIAFYNGVVRLLGALEIDVEPEFQSELDAHPFSKD